MFGVPGQGQRRAAGRVVPPRRSPGVPQRSVIVVQLLYDTWLTALGKGPGVIVVIGVGAGIGAGRGQEGLRDGVLGFIFAAMKLEHRIQIFGDTPVQQETIAQGIDLTEFLARHLVLLPAILPGRIDRYTRAYLIAKGAGGIRRKALVVIATVLGGHARFERIGRLITDKIDGAASVIATVEITLRAFQYFDAFHIVLDTTGHDGVSVGHFIQVQTDRTVAVGADIVEADAADGVYGNTGGAGVGQIQAGRVLGQVPCGNNAEILHLLAAKSGDCNTHIIQGLGPFLGGHDDLFQYRTSGDWGDRRQADSTYRQGQYRLGVTHHCHILS